jgi:hypothetical protein
MLYVHRQFVDQGMKEELTKNGVDRHADDAHLEADVCPHRRGGDDMVQDSAQMTDVANLYDRL